MGVCVRTFVMTLVLLTQLGCAACGQNLGVVTHDRPNVGPVDDHQIRCDCNAFSTIRLPDGGPHIEPFSIDLCAPAEINTSLGATLTAEQYATGVNRFCRISVPRMIRALAGSVAGEDEALVCGALVVTCAPGRLSSADAGSDGGAIAAVAPNLNCDKPCTDVQCVVGLPSGEIVPPDAGQVNCFSLSAVDLNTGEIDPTHCSCTRMSGCGITMDGGICQPLSTVIDPPTIDTGFRTYTLAQPTTADFDANSSSIHLMLVVPVCDLTNTVCVNVTTTAASPIRGELTLYGRPCPNAECDLRVGFAAYPENLMMGPVCVDGFCTPPVSLTDMAITGGTSDVSVHVDSNGHLNIPTGVMSILATGVREDRRFLIEASNPNDLLLVVDWEHGTIRTPGPITQSLAQGSGVTVSIATVMTNRPPRVVLPQMLTAECTSPQGARVVLDGEATADPDGDPVRFAWWRGAPFVLQLSSARTIEVGVPLGDTVFSASAMDTRLVTDVRAVTVHVADTTAPALELDVEPDCLWPPDHKLRLLSLNREIQALATDSCDPSASIEIIGVHSNEDVEARGSGSTAPDIVWGPSAVCLRAERAGPLAGRVYTIDVRASDDAGNSTVRSVEVSVPHDRRGGACRKAQVETVADDDPRCAAGSSSSQITEPQSIPRNAVPSDPAPSGCSTAGSGPLVALFLLLSRRRGWRLTLSGVALVASLTACTVPAKTPDASGYKECVQGWWIDGTSTSACACPTQAECDAGDCAGYAFLAIFDDTWRTGSLSISTATRSCSTQARITAAPYSVVGPGRLLVRFDPNEKEMAVQCTSADAGVIVNGIKKVPMDPALARELEQEVRNGSTTWSAVSY